MNRGDVVPLIPIFDVSLPKEPLFDLTLERSAEFIPVTDRLHLFLRYARLRFRKDYAGAIITLFCGTLYHNDELSLSVGALHFAAIYGRVDLIHKFIRKGADPNKIDNHSITPLHYAVLSGRAEVVDAFLSGDGSVNVNIADSLCRRTALHTAIINKVDNRIITALINNNANLSLIDQRMYCTALCCDK